MSEPRILCREVEAVRTGINLEKAPVSLRLIDHTPDVQFVTRPLEQKATRGMPKILK